MADLRDKLTTHWDIVRWRSTVDAFYESLENQSKDAVKKLIKDPSILNPNAAGVKQLLAGYGDTALNEITAELRKWFDAYKWKS